MSCRGPPAALCGQGSAKMLEFLYGTHMFVAIVDDEARTTAITT